MWSGKFKVGYRNVVNWPFFWATFTLAPEVFQNIGIGNSASSSQKMQIVAQ